MGFGVTLEKDIVIKPFKKYIKKTTMWSLTLDPTKTNIFARSSFVDFVGSSTMVAATFPVGYGG